MHRTSEDHQRFLALLGAHERSLLKVSWAYGRTSHDREDLLQEIVGRLWRSFRKYDQTRVFSTWMYRVALNVAIDFQRRQRRWGRESARFSDGVISDPVASEDGVRRERLEELHELLAELGDPDRAILLLHLEGHAHGEIGEILGISGTNVGTRLSRLRTALRRSVQGTSIQRED